MTSACLSKLRCLRNALWGGLVFYALYASAAAAAAPYDADVSSTMNPYEQRRLKVREQKIERISSHADADEDSALDIVALPLPEKKISRQPLKVTIPNISNISQARHPAATLIARSGSGNGRPLYTPLPDNPAPLALAAAAPSDNVFDQLFAKFSPSEKQQVPAAPPARIPVASTNVYQSPPVIVKKETLHMATEQPEMAQAAPPSIIPSLTPVQLAALAPAAGEDAPLIQIPAEAPPPPPPAIPPAPPPAVPPAPPPTAESVPPAAPAAPLSDVKPLLETAPQPLPPVAAAPPPPPTAAPPPDASIDTLLQSAGKPSEPAPLPPAAVPPEVAAAVKNEPPHQDTPVPVMQEPAPSLSPESKAIAAKIPTNLDHKKEKLKKIAIDHAKDKNDLGNAEPAVKSVKHDGMNISVESKTPKVDSNYQLEQAYNAMSTGHTSEAIDLYKNILSNDPKNKSALFGLATAYHRAGQIDMARPLYAKLLAIDPNNRDGLNNFLVLLADEAPEEALAQLEQLEGRNPQFSPIPAQMAVIYEKLGNSDKASEKMFRAVELAPENLTYRYNLAIMLDKQKKYEEAAKLYRQIVEAYKRGEVIPGNIQKIQQRLTFISSNRQ